MYRKSNLEIGYSNNSSAVLRYMGNEGINNIREYLMLSLSKKYMTYNNIEEVKAMIKGATDIYLTTEEKEILKEYTGYYFKFINNAMRGNWNYDVNGDIKNMPRYQELGTKLSELLMLKGVSIGNTKVFRGVTLEFFKDYGIYTLDELDYLKGKPLIDFGFVSTSLLEDSCYYKKELETGLNYNVKIEYLVPDDFNNGLYLGNVSYSPNQNEYLISSGNMAHVVDVIHETDGVVIKAILIPKEVYDIGYRKYLEEQKAIIR